MNLRSGWRAQFHRIVMLIWVCVNLQYVCLFVIPLRIYLFSFVLNAVRYKSGIFCNMPKSSVAEVYEYTIEHTSKEMSR